MAGRGRGRGGAGRGRGQSMPSYFPDDLKKSLEGAVVQPPQLYPILRYRPVPLKLGPEYSNRIKSSIFASPSAAPFRFFREDLNSGWKFQLRHLFKEETKKDIDRYTDRYAETPQVPQQNCDIDFSRIPKELKPCRKRKLKTKSVVESQKRRHTEEATQLIKNLEELEKQAEEEAEDEADAGEDKKKQDGDEEEEEEEEEAYDSDYEENDYNQDYFDNGERYGDDSDGSGGEAIY